MAETETISFDKALAKNRFEELAPRIAALPDKEEFKSTVQEDLWEKLGGDSDSDWVWYDDLGESQSIFGIEQNTGSVPWWLEDFEWTARMGSEEAGEKQSLNDIDSLETFEENFDPGRTKIEKPVLTANITQILGGFSQLRQALDEEIDEVQFTEEADFPDHVFEFSDGRVETSEEYRDWFFEELLNLCPPYNETLTALFNANTNIKVDVLDELYDDEFRTRLEELGLISQSDSKTERVYHEDYYEGIQNILTYREKRHFDCLLPETTHDDLGSIEEDFYQSYVGYPSTKKAEKWLRRAADGDPGELQEGQEVEFAEMAFQLPLSLEYYSSKFDSPKPKYTTLGINRTARGESAGYGSNPNRPSQILELVGIQIDD